MKIPNIVPRILITVTAGALSGCAKPPSPAPPPPPPKPCTDPWQCSHVTLELDYTGACAIPGEPSSTRRYRWYARNYATYTTTRKIKYTVVRERYYQGGTKISEDPPEDVIVGTGEAKPLGCQIGTETPYGASLLEYKMRVTCVRWEADTRCIPPSTRKTYSDVVCPSDIPGSGEFTQALAWLKSTLKDEQSFPLSPTAVEHQFTSTPGNCTRNLITLNGTLVQNTGQACYVNAAFERNGQKTELSIDIPTIIVATKIQTNNRVALEFAEGRRPSLRVATNGTVDTAHTGTVVGATIDQIRLRIYVNNKGGETTCVSYRYRR
jgi:hypothetical protein